MNTLLSSITILVATILIGGYLRLAIAMFHDTKDRDPYHNHPEL